MGQNQASGKAIWECRPPMCGTGCHPYTSVSSAFDTVKVDDAIISELSRQVTHAVWVPPSPETQSAREREDQWRRELEAEMSRQREDRRQRELDEAARRCEEPWQQDLNEVHGSRTHAERQQDDMNREQVENSEFEVGTREQLSKPAEHLSPETCDTEEIQAPDDQEKWAKVAAFLSQNGFGGITTKRGMRMLKINYPLHVAVTQQNAEMVRLLIQARADTVQVNSSGQTPLQLAKRSNRNGTHDQVVEALEELGG